MREIFQGIEIQSINKDNIGVIYFDNGNLYIGCSKDKLPIIIKDIRSETLKQLGEFFTHYGNYPERAANRLDFSNQYMNIQFKFDKTYFYIISKERILEMYPLGTVEIKKIGTWLRKQLKTNNIENEE